MRHFVLVALVVVAAAALVAGAADARRVIRRRPVLLSKKRGARAEQTLAEIQAELGLTKSSPYMELSAKGEKVIAEADVPTMTSALVATIVDASVSGAVADVRVSQVYTNPLKEPVNVRYVFPASTTAAVYALTMFVEDRVVVAELKSREQARADFEQAVSEGRTASLLEQERPNVFAMELGNVLPGEQIVIQMLYTELLLPEAGKYTWYYPSVVGPRYKGEGGEALKEPPIAGGDGSGAGGPSWAIRVRVDAGAPLTELASSTHQADVDKAAGLITLAASEAQHTNKDFYCEWTLSGGAIVTGVLGYAPPEAAAAAAATALSAEEVDALVAAARTKRSFDGVARDERLVAPLAVVGDGRAARPLGVAKKVLGTYSNGDAAERFVFVTVMPPPRAAITKRAPREYIFVMDVSGSMLGFPLDTSFALIRKLLGNVNDNDYVNVVQFAGGSATYADEPVLATKENIEKIVAFCDPANANYLRGGGTDVLSAFRSVIALARSPVKGAARSIVVLTDGFVSVEEQAFKLVRDNLDTGSWYAASIGSSPNRFLTQGVARVGGGREFVAINEVDAPLVADQLIAAMDTTLLTKVGVAIRGVSIVEGSQQPRKVPDLRGEQPIVVSAKWTGTVAPDAMVTVTGLDAAGEPWKSDTPLSDAALRDPVNDALPLLWARERLDVIRYTQSRGVARDNATRDVALKYGLLSDVTSFVAIDVAVRVKPSNDTMTIDQAVPKPEDSFGEADYGGFPGGGGGFGSAGFGSGAAALGADTLLVAAGVALSTLLASALTL